MATTEQHPIRREPRRATSPLELRLYVAALFAAVYTLAWRAIGDQAMPADGASASAPTPTPVQMAIEPPHYVWFDSLPPLTRPLIVLPAGWQLAGAQRPTAPMIGQPVATPQPARRVSVPVRRVPRVRTRSS